MTDRQNMSLAKWIDIPPVWLVAGLVLAGWQSRALPMGLSFGGSWSTYVGGVLIIAGLVLIGLAIHQFRRHQTTPIPHQTPSRLITNGVFGHSRNPIYLGDILILTGVILRSDAVLSLVLIPTFVWVVEQRFILPEENRLRETFPEDFAAYEQKVRRWL